MAMKRLQWQVEDLDEPVALASVTMPDPLEAHRVRGRFVPAWPGQVCSLGYQVGPLIEGDLGIVLTGEQQDRLIEYYRVDPVTGSRVVRRAAVRRPKGAGKSPEGAYCGYAELIGPVLFGGWDAGQPVGVAHLIMGAVRGGVGGSDRQRGGVAVRHPERTAPEVCKARGIDLGRTRIYLQGRPGRIEPVTASAGSREGQRVTFAVLDQTESWSKENGGVRPGRGRSAATQRRCPAGRWSSRTPGPSAERVGR